MPWTICSEIFPTNIRGVATSITTVCNWAFNFVVSSSFLTLLKVLSRQGTFLLYASLTFGFFCLLFVYLPETRNVSLEDMPTLFSNSLFGKRLQRGDYNGLVDDGESHAGTSIISTLITFCCCRRLRTSVGAGATTDDSVKESILHTPYTSLLAKSEISGHGDRGFDTNSSLSATPSDSLGGGGRGGGGVGSGAKESPCSVRSLSPIRPVSKRQSATGTVAI